GRVGRAAQRRGPPDPRGQVNVPAGPVGLAAARLDPPYFFRRRTTRHSPAAPRPARARLPGSGTPTGAAMSNSVTGPNRPPTMSMAVNAPVARLMVPKIDPSAVPIEA